MVLEVTATAVSIVPLVPDVVQVAVVVLAKMTGLLVGVPVAESVRVLPTWKATVAAGFKLVIACATLVMVKLSVTCGAAA